MYSQYGYEVVPLGTFIERFCLKQGNMKESNIIQQLVYASDAWKKMFRNTIWEVKRQVFEVDCIKNTIQLPSRCERVLNISIVDRAGRLHPLTCDSNLNTAQIKCMKPKCSCNNCNGQGTFCGAVDSVTYTTQEIVIQGQTFTQQTWIKYDGAGNIIQDILRPSYSVELGKVIFQHDISTICNVQTTSCGCIEATQPNFEALNNYLGVGWYDGFGGAWAAPFKDLVPAVYNYFGYYNFNAADPSIVHIFRNDVGRSRNYVTNVVNGNAQQYTNDIRQVVVAFQTNGEDPDKELLIPKYAEACLEAGIMYYQKNYNMKVPANEKKMYKYAWRQEMKEVMQYLNPIDMQTIWKLQTQARPW